MDCIVPVKAGEKKLKLGPAHDAVQDEVLANPLMAPFLLKKEKLKLGMGQQSQTQCPFTKRPRGLNSGPQHGQDIFAAQPAALPGNLSQAGTLRPLPQKSLIQILPGHLARVIEVLSEKKPPFRDTPLIKVPAVKSLP